MTFSIPAGSNNARSAVLARSTRAFTLVEVIVSLLILSLISGAVFSAFVFFGKSGMSIGRYVDIDQQARKALETFASEARMAADIKWTSSTELELKVPFGELDSAGFYYVTYQYFDASYGTASLRETFSRQVPSGKSSNTTLMPEDSSPVPLLKGVSSLTFRRYFVGTPTDPDASSTTIKQADTDSDTKQINLDLTAYRKGTIGTKATNIVISSRYILRNKLTTD